ncbi:MAG: sigma-70 family RNA polymerase sigma factor [Planctomycetes bacterium]|nr:sigma-70 family RNA polymerase sigma factor [Planctomycetota bacterium]
MHSSNPGDITLLLSRARSNDARAAEELFQRLYGELRALAGAAMQRDRAGHTLQPTAIVHEAWIKLAAPGALGVNDREHFLALAARAMRQVLVDHARGKEREKRGGGREAISLHDEAAPSGMAEIDVLVLEEALERLAQYSALKARIVELRFFGGLSIDEIANVVGLSSSSVDREWSFARAWLSEALAGGFDGE